MDADRVGAEHFDELQGRLGPALHQLLRAEIGAQQGRPRRPGREGRQQLRLIEEDAHRSDAECDAHLLRQSSEIAIDLPGPLGAAGHPDDHQGRRKSLAAKLGREIDLVQRKLGQRPVDEPHAGKKRIGTFGLDLVLLDEIEMLGLALLEIVVHGWVIITARLLH